MKDKTYALNRWWSGNYFITEVDKNSTELESVNELKQQIENLKLSFKRCVQNNARLTHFPWYIELDTSNWFSKVSKQYGIYNTGLRLVSSI